MANYCLATNQTIRWKTREVPVGNVLVGGHNPIRIQSMTTSPTDSLEETVGQIMQLADSGCEIARVTVQGLKEATACEGIKNTLLKKGYTIPLVADIHFFPRAAFHVVDFVDKIRINPGNFADPRAKFRISEYDEATYKMAIAQIEEKFSPLVEKCILLKKTMRIGTNHGSLSDRIMNRFGDTPKGMVESALEYAQICRKYNFHNFMFSMKASNPLIMIEAYRLLVQEMISLDWDYPLHLGVTEAGAGEDGRIKSAVGIGSLLLDGIGDTIRVSLTEDPWKEIPPCKHLAQFFSTVEKRTPKIHFTEKHRNPEKIEARSVKKSTKLHQDGSVIVPVSQEELLHPLFYSFIGAKEQLGSPEKSIATADGIFIEYIPPELAQKVQLLENAGISVFVQKKNASTLGTLVYTLQDALQQNRQNLAIEVTSMDRWDSLKDLSPEVIFFSDRRADSYFHEARAFFDWLKENNLDTPVILLKKYPALDDDQLYIEASAELGALLGDKLGEGIILSTQQSCQERTLFAFRLLQACRMRTFKTEFISCPGCGRTLFDLQEVAQRIREKTGHLPGIKIAIMGCIVNGPGEMADADFGYVGSRPGKIDLYVGKTCVKRNIDFSEADSQLIELIKEQGRWIELEELASTPG